MSSSVKIVVLVEGHGEARAVPILLHRIAQEIKPDVRLQVEVIRAPATKLRLEENISREIELAARKLAGRGAVLLLLDCDWPQGCPAKDGPSLLNKARAVRPDILTSVVLANHEFEAWFLAALGSLRGLNGVASDAIVPNDPESIRDAKGALGKFMVNGYSPTLHQEVLSRGFDMFQARRVSDSFDKFYREVERLMLQLTNNVE